MRFRRWRSRRRDLDKAARLLERRAVPSERQGERSSCRASATHGVPIELCERKERVRPRRSPARRGGSDQRARSRRDPHAQPRARRRLLCRPAGARSPARPQQSRLGLAAAVLPLRRSRGRDRARSEERRVGRPDHLWGLSWRTPDIAKANARLKAAGVDVSEPRNGRRPGTQVFSVQSHTEGVPTIVIGGVGHWYRRCALRHPRSFLCWPRAARPRRSLYAGAPGR